MLHLLAKELKRSKYRLLGLVGQGQFGRVYCASHRKTGRLVALKELDKERFPTHKFLRELRFLLSLQHANIVTCHALEHTPTGRYLVMDYCEGGTLRGLMEDDVRLHPDQCLKLTIDILAGLAHAHSRGIVHCDIKPENILLTLQADGWTARISDFGIARLHQELAGDGSGNTGSPAYMAPERFYGQYSMTSDLYAVGVLLFELLVGYRPFSGVPMEMMSAHLNRPVQIPATVPAVLQAVILMALQKLPARRFQSAAGMLAAVQKAALEPSVKHDRAWTDARLLRSIIVQPVHVCQYGQTQILQTKVQQLVTVAADMAPQTDLKVATRMDAVAEAQAADTCDRVYQVSQKHIGCWLDARRLVTHGEAIAGEADGRSLVTSVRLPQAVKELLVRPQGCFAITQRSIYRIPLELFQDGVVQVEQKPLQPAHSRSTLEQTIPELVAEFSSDFVATIETKGRWIAVAALEPDKITSLLSVWHLSRMQSLPALSRSGSMVTTSRLTAHLLHLAMPDSRYVVAFSHVLDKGTQSYITGVLLEIFTRRGNPVSAFSLPVPLRYLLSSATPYRLIALEPGQPYSILLIDLKPLKLLRVGIEIVPILMASASWGYILIAADGQIVALNRDGQTVGHLIGPTNPTAIALLEPHGLLIATWAKGQGTLVTIDLRQFDMGIVF